MTEAKCYYQQLVDRGAMDQLLGPLPPLLGHHTVWLDTTDQQVCNGGCKHCWRL
jgi:hypothetical protein